MGVVVVKTIEEWVIGRWRRPFRIWCKFRGIKLWRLVFTRCDIQSERLLTRKKIV
jgi:hypothetical protein